MNHANRGRVTLRQAVGQADRRTNFLYTGLDSIAYTIRQAVLSTRQVPWDAAILPYSDDIAFRIYQALLDGSGDAVNLGDFDRFLPFFHLPTVVETFEARAVFDGSAPRGGVRGRARRLLA